jgi:titin
VHTIRPIAGLPQISCPVTIDGTTQPGFAGSPLIELSGVDADLEASGLVLQTDNSTIKGLVINGFRFNPDYGPTTTGLRIHGSGNVVQGNYIGTDARGTQALGQDQGGVFVYGSNNLIGGTTASERNLISGNGGVGVWLASGSGNVVQGNYIGTDVTGTAALSNGYNIDIGSNNNLVGGTTPGAGNLVAASPNYGIHIIGSGNVVQGNHIGTDVTGTVALGNRRGVWLSGTAFGATNNRIGGTAPGAGNLIAGNNTGILIDQSNGNVVQGNRIGTDATGTTSLGNNGNGVLLSGVSASNNTIGGTGSGAGNTIAFNANDGVLVDRGTGNAILGNAVFANGNLGIELVNGGNHNQAAPVITSATTDGSGTTVSGTLSSTANTTFTLEIFANSVCDPSGSGERVLGSVQVTTDADGHAGFTATFAVAIDPGWFLTATATGPDNNTSPFSAAVAVTG